MNKFGVHSRKQYIYAALIIIIASLLGGCGSVRSHSFTISGEERLKSEEIEPLADTVRVFGTKDTDVIFTDVLTGECFTIGYLTPGVSESIHLERGKWYKVEGNGILTLKPVNVRIADSTETTPAFTSSENTALADIVSVDKTSEMPRISTSTVFMDNCKEPKIPLEKRMTGKPDKDDLTPGVATVFYEDAPFTAGFDRVDADGKLFFEPIEHEFHLADFNYLYKYELEGDLCWRSYLLDDYDGDGINELYFEVSAIPDQCVDRYISANVPRYYVAFSEEENGVFLHIIREDTAIESWLEQKFWDGEECVALPQKFEDRLLVAPEREQVPKEIAAVIYDGASFTAVDHMYVSEEEVSFYKREFTMPEYDYISYSDDALAAGKYRHTDVYWNGYTIIDLDKDGSDELVYCVSSDFHSDEYYMIFSVVDGSVYAYNIGFREFGTLMTDGTMDSESGASWCDIYEITDFTKDGYKTRILAKMRDDYENGDENYHSYYVRDKKVSYEEYQRYINEERSTKGVIWIATERVDDWLNYYSRE